MAHKLGHRCSTLIFIIILEGIILKLRTIEIIDKKSWVGALVPIF